MGNSHNVPERDPGVCPSGVNLKLRGDLRYWAAMIGAVLLIAAIMFDGWYDKPEKGNWLALLPNGAYLRVQEMERTPLLVRLISSPYTYPRLTLQEVRGMTEFEAREILSGNLKQRGVPHGARAK